MVHDDIEQYADAAFVCLVDHQLKCGFVTVVWINLVKSSAQ